jgi:hypothetical protein
MERNVEMTHEQVAMASARRQMTMWGAAFMLGTFGVAGAGFFLDIEGWLVAGMFMAAMTLMIPFIRAGERYQAISGSGSPALRRYNRRFLSASIAYSLLLMSAIWLSQQADWPTPVLVLIALAPVIPTLGMIWTMARLIIEEQDEYLRANFVRDALFATGLMLSLAVTWGFLEQFNLTPHIPSWWVFPAWAISLGVGQCWRRARS